MTTISLRDMERLYAETAERDCLTFGLDPLRDGVAWRCSNPVHRIDRVQPDGCLASEVVRRGQGYFLDAYEALLRAHDHVVRPLTPEQREQDRIRRRQWRAAWRIP
jgi:hypothetical protein